MVLRVTVVADTGPPAFRAVGESMKPLPLQIGDVAGGRSAVCSATISVATAQACWWPRLTESRRTCAWMGSCPQWRCSRGYQTQAGIEAGQVRLVNREGHGFAHEMPTALAAESAQECTVKVVLSGLPSVVVRRRHAALHVAVDDALHAVEQAVRRTVRRRRMKPLHGRWSRQAAGGGGRSPPRGRWRNSVSRFKKDYEPMDVFKQMHDGGHEEVVFARDAEAGLTAIIAIHSPALGPALGGDANVLRTPRRNKAVLDVLELSRGMTYKAAAAGLNLGGGKAVIIWRNAVEVNRNRYSGPSVASSTE